MFEIKRPKLPFINCVMYLKLGARLSPSKAMLYEFPDEKMKITELWRWCKE